MKQSKKKVILKLIIKHLLKNSLIKLKKNNFDYLLNIKLFLAFKLKNKKEENYNNRLSRQLTDINLNRNSINLIIKHAENFYGKTNYQNELIKIKENQMKLNSILIFKKLKKLIINNNNIKKLKLKLKKLNLQKLKLKLKKLNLQKTNLQKIKLEKLTEKKNIYAIWYLLFKLKNLTNVKTRKNE